MKFIKRPVTVEAFQLTAKVFASLEEQVDIPKTKDIIYDPRTKTATIFTLEGNMTARENDWIIKGVNGEYYPCKPDIFEKTYAPVPNATLGFKVPTLLTRGEVKFQHYGDNLMFRLHVEAKDLQDAMKIYEQVKGKTGKVFFEED